jgi:hypothetical protein
MNERFCRGRYSWPARPLTRSELERYRGQTGDADEFTYFNGTRDLVKRPHSLVVH